MNKKNKANYLRDIIKKYDLMQYIEDIAINKRDKDIIQKYISGQSKSSIARECGCVVNNIHRVVYHYIVLVGKQTKRNYLLDNLEL